MGEALVELPVDVFHTGRVGGEAVFCPLLPFGGQYQGAGSGGVGQEAGVGDGLPYGVGHHLKPPCVDRHGAQRFGGLEPHGQVELLCRGGGGFQVEECRLGDGVGDCCRQGGGVTLLAGLLDGLQFLLPGFLRGFLVGLGPSPEHFQRVGLPGEPVEGVGLLVSGGQEYGVLVDKGGVGQPVDQRVAFGACLHHRKLVEAVAREAAVGDGQLRHRVERRAEFKLEVTLGGTLVVAQVLAAVVLVEPCQQYVVGEVMPCLPYCHGVFPRR